MFIKSAESDSDILTKNLGGELHKNHPKKLMDKQPKVLPTFKNIQRLTEGCMMFDHQMFTLELLL